MTERLTQTDLHSRFVDAIGEENIRCVGSLEEKPLLLELSPPLPHRVRVYLFNATRPPGGRPLGEHKVQLITPGQKRGVRGNFDHSGGRIVLLCGYVSEEDVFVFWDAGLYSDFAWSRNVQVKSETIIKASAGKIAIQERSLRPRNAKVITENVVAVRSDRLTAGIVERMNLVRRRMLDSDA